MRLIFLLFFLIQFAFGQTRDSIVNVHYQKDTTHLTCKDTTYKVWRDSSYVIKIDMDTLFRGMYVNSFNTIVSDPVKQNALIADAKTLKLNHISCYSISTTNNPAALAAFIPKLKRNTKIKTIAPAISSTSGITSWRGWNNTHPDSSDVDELTLEFEFYNQTDFKTAWKTNCALFQEMNKAVKDGTFKGMNDYKGWWTSSSRDLSPATTQCPDTEVFYFSVPINDLYLHDYRVAPDYGYMDKRINDLNNSGIEQGKVIRIVVLFSAEPDFMGGWLKAGHTLDEAFWIVYNAFKLKKYSNVRMLGWMCFHLDYWRANHSTTNVAARMSAPAPIIFSEKGFSNKTTRKHKKVAKHLE